eukprot:COSAG01_NODE_26000_length_726_cov_1.392344_1_plen_48_part_01
MPPFLPLTFLILRLAHSLLLGLCCIAALHNLCILEFVKFRYPSPSAIR